MLAIRQIKQVVGNTVTIELPAGFSSRQVEVIVLPLPKENQLEHLRDLLLTAPTSSEEDLQEFAQLRDWMSQWTVNEF